MRVSVVTFFVELSEQKFSSLTNIDVGLESQYFAIHFTHVMALTINPVISLLFPVLSGQLYFEKKKAGRNALHVRVQQRFMYYILI